MKKIICLVLLSLALLLSGCITKRIVTFDSNNGLDITTQYVNNGFKATEPDEPEKFGYNFIGWFLDDKKFDFEKTTIMENITLIAKWQLKENFYEVIFVDYDDTIISNQIIEKGKNAEIPDDPIREGYVFAGWDQDFTNVTSNLRVTAIYEEDTESYTVIFVDYDGTILSTQKVKEGNNAKAPNNPSRLGYIFNGWDQDFTNVNSNLTVTAKYKIDTTTYKIIYELNGGTWGYANKNEIVLAFLTDFYDFVKPTESFLVFAHGSGKVSGFAGEWTKYIGGNYPGTNYLLYNNDLSADHNDYFFNSGKYKDKWYDFGQWIHNMNYANKRFGGTSYQYGTLDFYRYIINEPQGYLASYGGEEVFYGYPDVIIEKIEHYQYSNSDIELPKPINPNFLGWYFNSDFTGAPVTIIPAQSIGDKTLYANWGVTTTYQIVFDSNGGSPLVAITVEYGEIISLPIPIKDGCNFIDWLYNGSPVPNPLTYTYDTAIILRASWKENNITNIDLSYDGTVVKYRNSSTVVQIPSAYVTQNSEFRGVWVTSYVGDFTPSTNKTTMMARLNNVLDTLEAYNMNAIIFHVRTTNNAYYKTKLAPIDSNYGTYQSFEEWDYLEWFIDECHRRGIEFHAWMNPYRIRASGYPAGTTASKVAEAYINYPDNPASNPDNILMTSSSGAILNPAKKEVQNSIIDICLEFLENYNADAIHFDDYFYAQMSSNNAVLTEPDQKDYEDFINANPSSGYSKTNSSHKEQWRRDQIDSFISGLSQKMRSFNAEKNREVQLGISPTGIYRNGNGVVTYGSDGTAITTGSNTSGQEHWRSYLFSDSKKWIDNEWIDYIIPQSYWAFTHTVAGYADVMDWWAKVIKNKKVNLYSGIGLYMSINGGNYSWGAQAYELSNQVLYTTKHPEIQGVCIFSYKSMISAQNTTIVSNPGLIRLQTEYWIKKVPTPKTMAHKK